jgi:integral membrane sensor domain MASE1
VENWSGSGSVPPNAPIKPRQPFGNIVCSISGILELWGDGLAVSSPQAANRLRLESRSIFSCELDLGVGVEFPSVIVGGRKRSAIAVSSIGSTILNKCGECSSPYDSQSRSTTGYLMGSEHGHRFPSITSASSPRSVAALVCLVVAVSYLAPKLEGAMILNPKTVWPFWPGSAILVSVLLLVPTRIWPILISAAFVTFALYDLEAGVPLRSVAWFFPANTVQVLTSSLCLRYFFHGVPRLNSVKAVAKYAFFAVILAPAGAAFFSANGIGGNYWEGWRVCFLSEALAFVTLTPAILSWITEGPAWVRKPRVCYLEPAALLTGLVLLSYVIFAEEGGGFTEFARAGVEPYLLTVPHLQHLPEAGQDGCETRLSSAGQQATPIV